MMQKLESQEQFWQIIPSSIQQIPLKERVSNCIFLKDQVIEMVKQGLFYLPLEKGFLLLEDHTTFYQLFYCLDARYRISLPKMNIPLIVDFFFREPRNKKTLDAVQAFLGFGFVEISYAQKMELGLRDAADYRHDPEIAPVQESHLSEVVRIWNECLWKKIGDPKYSLSDALPFWEEKNLFGIWEDGKLAGVVIGQISGRICTIKRLSVSNEYRRRHLGDRLLRQVLSIAERDGADESWLWVETTNQKALNLYKQVGYVPVNQYNVRMLI